MLAVGEGKKNRNKSRQWQETGGLTDAHACSLHFFFSERKVFSCSIGLVCLLVCDTSQALTSCVLITVSQVFCYLIIPPDSSSLNV